MHETFFFSGPAPATPSAPERPWLEWILQRRALAEARGSDSFDERARSSVARARAAFEAGERLLFGLEPLRAEHAREIALELFGQSTFWALSAASGKAIGDDVDAMVAQASMGDPETAAVLRSMHESGLDVVLLRQTFGQRTPRSAESLAHDVMRSRSLLRRLLARLEARAVSRRRVLARRWTRTPLVVFALSMALFLSIRLVWGPRDIAVEKPWVTSSTYGSYAASGKVPPEDQDLGFFHTSNEESPWIRIDLERKRQVGRLIVKNRIDCCHDRGLPLVVELSSDGASWVEVARRTSEFESWEPRFAMGSDARFIRLRAEAKTILHLSRVRAYAE
jgi:hypothetical protein